MKTFFFIFAVVSWTVETVDLPRCTQADLEIAGERWRLVEEWGLGAGTRAIDATWGQYGELFFGAVHRDRCDVRLIRPGRKVVQPVPGLPARGSCGVSGAGGEVYFSTNRGLYRWNSEHRIARKVQGVLSAATAVYGASEELFVVEASAGAGGELDVWRVKGRRRELLSAMDSLNAMAVTVDGDAFFLRLGRLYVLRAEDLAPINLGMVPHADFQQLAISGRRVLVASGRLLWRDSKGGGGYATEAGKEEIWAVAVDEERLALGYGARLRLYRRLDNCYLRALRQNESNLYDL